MSEVLKWVNLSQQQEREITALKSRLSSARELVEELKEAVKEYSDAMSIDSDKELISQAEAWLKEKKND